MIRSLLLLILLAVCSNAVRMDQRVHRSIDISQYVYNRKMTINPCYILLDDPASTFHFQPLLLTITTPCSTHTCSYTLKNFDFSLGECSQVATTTCSQDDPAEDYIKMFTSSKAVVLQANIITLVDEKGHPTLQLKDIK